LLSRFHLRFAAQTVDARAAVRIRLALSIYMCSRHLKKKQVLFLEKIFLRGSIVRFRVRSTDNVWSLDGRFQVAKTAATRLKNA
jgi:hypothetical protein